MSPEISGEFRAVRLRGPLESFSGLSNSVEAGLKAVRADVKRLNGWLVCEEAWRSAIETCPIKF